MSGHHDQRKMLALDFDGVLHSYSSGWRGARVTPDPPVDGALDFLVLALDTFDVCVFSSRSRYIGGRRAMRRWLRHWLTEREWATVTPMEDVGAMAGVYYTHGDVEEAIALKIDAIIRRIRFPLWKPPAHVTIDDRAMTFTGAFPTIDEIVAFRPWNRITDK